VQRYKYEMGIGQLTSRMVILYYLDDNGSYYLHDCVLRKTVVKTDDDIIHHASVGTYCLGKVAEETDDEARWMMQNKMCASREHRIRNERTRTNEIRTKVTDLRDRSLFM
jgi:hypothetical protein